MATHEHPLRTQILKMTGANDVNAGLRGNTTAARVKAAGIAPRIKPKGTLSSGATAMDYRSDPEGVRKMAKAKKKKKKNK